MTGRRHLLLIFAACSAGAALAQAYPSRPIRFVVPFPPGGGNDIVGRIVAKNLADVLGGQIVIDNRGGAGGTIGTEIVARSAPDGHTLLINNISLAVNATLIPKLSYDTVKDLEPVSLIGRQPNLLVVATASPAKSVRELIELGRAKGQPLNYGSGGVGTASHLATEYMKLITRAELVHVPYKGLAPAVVDLVAGRLDFIISTVATALPQLKAGRLRPLAVTTPARSASYPDVPTMNEAGLKGYEFDTWYGLLAAGRTPPPVVYRVNRALVETLAAPAVVEQLALQGVEPSPSSPKQFSTYLRAEIAKWAKVIKASGATAE
ncbi:MAG: tripartite tricarboxylate transporter substrate binding protein [Proteobacteria bacterium]|nr:tripartite tricarboxylate transporter substrate binding protein [Burkholderiales bacterium]